MTQKKAPNPAFKKQAIAVVIVAAVVGIGIQVFLASDANEEPAALSTAEPLSSERASASYEALPDTEGALDVSNGEALVSTEDLLDPIPTQDDDPGLEPIDDAPLPQQNKDPAAARLLLHPECHRYRHVLNETYRDPSPWALARRKVGMDILTEIGCFDASGSRPKLNHQHPDGRLLLSGRGTAEQYLSIVTPRSGQTCQTWASVLAQMAASPTASEEDIAEYFSRTKASRCPSPTLTGYRGFGAARWDTTSPPVSSYPETAIAAIRLVRANPRCVDFVHDLSEAAETVPEPDLAMALSGTLQLAHQSGCLYP